jgi:hypothetical protein
MMPTETAGGCAVVAAEGVALEAARSAARAEAGGAARRRSTAGADDASDRALGEGRDEGDDERVEVVSASGLSSGSARGADGAAAVSLR